MKQTICSTNKLSETVLDLWGYRDSDMECACAASRVYSLGTPSDRESLFPTSEGTRTLTCRLGLHIKQFVCSTRLFMFIHTYIYTYIYTHTCIYIYTNSCWWNKQFVCWTRLFMKTAEWKLLAPEMLTALSLWVLSR